MRALLKLSNTRMIGNSDVVVVRVVLENALLVRWDGLSLSSSSKLSTTEVEEVMVVFDSTVAGS